MAGFSSPSALNTPSTLAAPDMSNFISSMSGAGLMEMPPLSKVMPLPTSTVGASPLGPPWYCSTMKRSGSAEPCATDMNEPMPSLATALWSSTSHFILPALAMAWAVPGQVAGGWRGWPGGWPIPWPAPRR